jgi:hypothetical protein
MNNTIRYIKLLNNEMNVSFEKRPLNVLTRGNIMKFQTFLCIVTGIILIASFPPDASEEKQGSWKLVQIWGMLAEPKWFANRCELITFKSDSADYFINGALQFSGSVDSLISKYYKNCSLSVTRDTLRFVRTQECCDIPFSWEWVRYSDSLANFDGKWRWVETMGGITGVSRTQSDYFNILSVNGTNVVNTINDSVVFSGKRDSLLFAYHGIRYTWVMTTDTLFAFQKPQCCDMPYNLKWVRWVSGQSGIQISHQRTTFHTNENPIYFDIRGRKIVSVSKSANGIHLLYNKNNSVRIIMSLHTITQIGD